MYAVVEKNNGGCGCGTHNRIAGAVVKKHAVVSRLRLFDPSLISIIYISTATCFDTYYFGPRYESIVITASVIVIIVSKTITTRHYSV